MLLVRMSNSWADSTLAAVGTGGDLPAVRRLDTGDGQRRRQSGEIGPRGLFIKDLLEGGSQLLIVGTAQSQRPRLGDVLRQDLRHQAPGIDIGELHRYRGGVAVHGGLAHLILQPPGAGLHEVHDLLGHGIVAVHVLQIRQLQIVTVFKALGNGLLVQLLQALAELTHHALRAGGLAAAGGKAQRQHQRQHQGNHFFHRLLPFSVIVLFLVGFMPSTHYIISLIP